MPSLKQALKSWPSWAGGILGMIFCWAVLFGWQIVSVVYHDHQSLVVANARLTADNTQLSTKLEDAQANAESRCEQAKGAEIKRLKKQLGAVCYNPDRNLTAMEQDQLFAALKRVRIEMEKQKQTPTFHFSGFTGDAETSRFVSKVLPIFQNAGWQWKPTILPPFTDAKKKQADTEQADQEKWMLERGFVEGVFVFDKNWPKGFGGSVAMAFSQVGLADWTLSNREETKDLPHLEGLTVWVGYKHVLSR